MSNDRRIDWMALVAGALTDILGTMAFVSLLAAIAGSIAETQHVPASEMEARLQRPLSIIALMIIGMAFTVLGGFVAGRVSKAREVLHGALVGSLGIVFAVLSWGTLPLWYDIASLVVVVPCGMLGGLIAKNRDKK